MSSFVFYGPGLWVKKRLKEAKETRRVSAKASNIRIRTTPVRVTKSVMCCLVSWGRLCAIYAIFLMPLEGHLVTLTRSEALRACVERMGTCTPRGGLHIRWPSAWHACKGVRKATCFPAHRQTRTSAKRFARPDKFEQWLMTVHLMWFGSTQEEAAVTWAPVRARTAPTLTAPPRRVCVPVCACVRACVPCVCACVRACVHVCVPACICAFVGSKSTAAWRAGCDCPSTCGMSLAVPAALCCAAVLRAVLLSCCAVLLCCCAVLLSLASSSPSFSLPSPVPARRRVGVGRIQFPLVLPVAEQLTRMQFDMFQCAPSRTLIRPRPGLSPHPRLPGWGRAAAGGGARGAVWRWRRCTKTRELTYQRWMKPQHKQQSSIFSYAQASAGASERNRDEDGTLCGLFV